MICDDTHIEGVNNSLDDSVGTGVHEGNTGLPEKAGVCGGAREDNECVAGAHHTPGFRVHINMKIWQILCLIITCQILGKCRLL